MSSERGSLMTLTKIVVDPCGFGDSYIGWFSTLYFKLDTAWFRKIEICTNSLIERSSKLELFPGNSLYQNIYIRNIILAYKF